MTERPEVSEPPQCTQEPKRWMTETPDEDAKIVCRGLPLQGIPCCPLRAFCARDAWETPDVSGLWAGVTVPDVQESSRGHTFALTQLKHIAELGGLQVRPHVRHHRRAEWQRLDNEARRAS